MGKKKGNYEDFNAGLEYLVFPDYEKLYGKLLDTALPDKLGKLFTSLVLSVFVNNPEDSNYTTSLYQLHLEASYADNFENETFSMHKYCWCERETCEYCFGNKPLFIHIPSGFAMSWYKYFPQGLQTNVSAKKLSFDDIQNIFVDCIGSL